MKVLVVEDNALTADLLCLALPGEGHSAERVGGVGEALALLEAGAAYDVILLDLCLPGGCGLELLRRAAPPWKGTPVVLFTAAAGPDLEPVCREFPGLMLLRKPAGLPEILAALRRAAATRNPPLCARCEAGLTPSEAALGRTICHDCYLLTDGHHLEDC